MRSTGCQKQDNLRLERGGRYAERPMRVFTTAELRLDTDMAELMGAIKGADGRPPTRGFRRVAYADAFPWRVLARWFVAARRKDAPKTQLVAVLVRLHRFVDGLYGDASDRTDRAA